MTFDPAGFERTLESVPLGPFGDPKFDIGAVAAFLLGDDSTYLTAQTLAVVGGAAVFR